MDILIVCTGNTCRSPMAEGILKELIKKRNLNFKVKSAGIAAFDGDKVSKKSVEALNKMKIDISNHKSRLVHDSLIDEANLILTMSKSHKELLVNKYPKSKGKIFLVNEFAFNVDEDISDPFGGSLKDYEIARDQIYQAMEEVLNKLENNKQ